MDHGKKEDFMDLRDFIKKCEEEGELKRIKAEVDWNLEMSHIAKLNEERGGPALLFEKVKGYPSPVISSVCTTTSRLALIMDMPIRWGPHPSPLRWVLMV